MFPWSRKPPLVLELNQTFSWRALIAKPTGAGYWLFFIAFAVWIGALNYAVSLAYALSFWLFAFLLISVLLVRQQLIGLKIARIEYDEVFAGDNAGVTINIHSENKKGRMFYVIYEETVKLVQMQDTDVASVTLNIPTFKRGMLFLPEITLYTIGPFGLMKTQLTFTLNDYIMVFPRPERYNLSTPLTQKDADSGGIRFKGEDDLSFLSEHLPGQSLRHIAWKNYAKTGRLLDKQFDNELTVNPKLISYNDYPKGTSIEQMASFMCQRVLDSEQKKQIYVVELPNLSISLQTNQRRVALNALGLWS